VVRRIPLLLLLAACQTRSAPPPKTTTPSLPAKSPASMSHGEATINNPAVPLERAADAPARSTSHLHYVRLRTVHISRVIAPGVVYQAWTFDSVVPAPTVRVTVGDTVDFTLVNGSPIPHSIDFHAAQVAPSRAYVNVNPKDSIHFRFVARVPGVFMYHCGTAPVALHISNGMFGALIVDPVTPRPPAREFVLVQSEYYLAPTHDSTAPRSLDWQRMLDLSPDYVVFNGVYAQYAAHPIQVEPGELLRFYVVDAGPNRVSSFHVVGAIFERVFVDGTGPPQLGVQTASVPVGGGMIFETRLAEPGLYPFVSHSFADATKGAVGVLRAGNPPGSASH
jgi:nitrite reductase (NO-forming)